MLIKEAPEELAFRAEEVGTQESCINVDHIAQDRWGPSLVDADWHAFFQAIYKGIGGKDWEDCTITTKKGVGRSMSRSQMETQKRKPFGR